MRSEVRSRLRSAQRPAGTHTGGNVQLVRRGGHRWRARGEGTGLLNARASAAFDDGEDIANRRHLEALDWNLDAKLLFGNEDQLDQCERVDTDVGKASVLCKVFGVDF